MQTKISFYRKLLHITQEDLGKAVGVTRQTIIALEQGKYNPSLGLAVKITRALGKKHVEEIFILNPDDL